MNQNDLAHRALNEFERAEREHEQDAMDARKDGNLRAASYHAGVAGGLGLARLIIKDLTGIGLRSERERKTPRRR